VLLALALVYALASAVLVAYGLHLLVLAGRRWTGRRPPAPAAPEPAVWPAVTVQLPVYDEPDVVERLIDAACALDYPHLEVQVLDDSPDGPALERAAARVARWRARGVDVGHLRRGTREGFKAGALAHGLAHARGDLLAVFDADFVPAPDFLRQTVPALAADPGLGLVQARWGHLNAGRSGLTRTQAALLDVHFVVEQGGRDAAGLFLSFNGTAGVWRRACIETAGGWQADTLTEDLDLSYRAQLAGWRFRFLEHVEAPAELPPTAAAWRRQQARWTKGTAETARKLLGRLWRAPLPLRVKVAGTLHLGGFAVYPALLVVVVLHPLLRLASAGPAAELAWGLAGALGGLALGGVAVAHLAAARALGRGGARRLLQLPAMLALPVGLAARNARAVAEAFAGRRTPFERTPKAGAALRAPREGWAAEGALALYAAGGAAALLAAGHVPGAAFQALFAAGAATVALHDRARRRARPAAPRPAAV
jgi:hypothetical protein